MLASGTSVNWWDATAATGMVITATMDITSNTLIDRDMKDPFPLVSPTAPAALSPWR
jgi:hypothetical protein